MFKCKHERKEKFFLPIKNIANVTINGEAHTYEMDCTQLYKCHDCGCIVWAEVKPIKES